MAELEYNWRRVSSFTNRLTEERTVTYSALIALGNDTVRVWRADVWQHDGMPGEGNTLQSQTYWTGAVEERFTSMAGLLKWITSPLPAAL